MLDLITVHNVALLSRRKSYNYGRRGRYDVTGIMNKESGCCILGLYHTIIHVAGSRAFGFAREAL